MNIRASLRQGALAAAVDVGIIILGLTGLVGSVLVKWLKLPSPAVGAWIVLVAIAWWTGSAVARRAERATWRQALVAGLLAGLMHGLLVALFTWGVGSLVASGSKVRQWLAQITPEAMELLTLGRQPLTGALILGGALALVTWAVCMLKWVSAQRAWGERLRGGWRQTTDRLAVPSATRAVGQNRYARLGLLAAGLVVLFAAPLLLGQYGNYTLGTVGIYIILGLGLNIVVGLAGILNLGYGAFFAIGAYTVALLTAPEPHGIQMNFWLALPIGVILSVVFGVLLCIPVLRTRGDYLAIVTLGFGEIVRILAKSDVLTSFTGGPKGVRDIGGPLLLGRSLQNEFHFMYIIIIGILLAALVSHRLQQSRVGRAWMAMREDEDVAQGMGVHTLKYKILAFAIGAGFAGLGGAIFASRNRFVGPEDFTLMVSINVLCLVIIGGMGSIPGVVLGALVLKGLPEMLRELDDYRFLAFGMLLIVMMLLRPEGLWPSARTRKAQEQQEEQAVPPREPLSGEAAGG
ncbi:MAG: leucine/isoleucine/valine transporter permease subunit [Anaerolineales bacterium]|nr:leucine/isoleucine/valine transporter permease subunit [Anaerolineales bacterium]